LVIPLFFIVTPLPLTSTLFPYTTLFRSQLGPIPRQIEAVQFGAQEMYTVPPEFLAGIDKRFMVVSAPLLFDDIDHGFRSVQDPEDRKSTRLNSSHVKISYAVFCLKKKKT